MIKAAPGEHAIIDEYTGSTDYAWEDIGGDSPSYVTIGDYDGTLELTNSDPWVDEVRKLDMNNSSDVATYKSQYKGDKRINSAGFAFWGKPDHLIIQNVIVHHFPGLGILGCGNNSKYINNTFYDLGDPRTGYGFYCGGDNNEFSRNLIHDVTIGFHLYGTPLNNSKVENNIVYNTGLKTFYHMSSGNVYPEGEGILDNSGGSGSSFQYNTVWNSGQAFQIGDNATVINTQNRHPVP
jgi:hypothetical protein